MKTIVYAETITKASRGYKPQPGETVAYRTFKDFADKGAEKGFDNYKVLKDGPEDIAISYNEQKKKKQKKINVL